MGKARFFDPELLVGRDARRGFFQFLAKKSINSVGIKVLLSAFEMLTCGFELRPCRRVNYCNGWTNPGMSCGHGYGGLSSEWRDPAIK